MRNVNQDRARPAADRYDRTADRYDDRRADDRHRD
jgi:hypothetical protein